MNVSLDQLVSQFRDDIALVFIDLFCGGGGTTTGIEHSKCFDKKAAKVIACVNHDAGAIASHQENHADCVHFTEDVRTVAMAPLVMLSRKARDLFPRAKHCLWASLECTNYSKAKGGMARDADSRTLKHSLFRYMDAMNFDYIYIENVEEFMTDGPMRIKPKFECETYTELTLIQDKKTGAMKYGYEPIPDTKGLFYIEWVEKMKSYGYNFEYKILNSADYGAHTSRRRYFAIFAKHGLPIVWPKQTHAKNPKPGSGLQKWRAVKEVLDLTDEGESIFGRKKKLSQKTLQRIHAGLVKYVAHGDTSFIQKYYSGRPAGKVTSINSPAGAITTFGNQSLVQTSQISSTNEPIGSLTTVNKQSVVTPVSLLKYNSTNQKTGVHVPPSLDEPSPVLSTQGRLGLINAEFLTYSYGNGYNSNIDLPAGTLTTKDRMQLVMPQQWIMSPHFNNKGSDVNEPMPTITANRKHHYLMFPQWGVNCAHSVEQPSPTLVARMDKMMPQFIAVEKTGEPIAIAVYDDDTEIEVEIKKFMAAYGIIDIKMRMLRIKEMKKITGFDENYILKGTQADQKKFIGNAVVVGTAKVLIESTAAAIIDMFFEKEETMVA